MGGEGDAASGRTIVLASNNKEGSTRPRPRRAQVHQRQALLANGAGEGAIIVSVTRSVEPPATGLGRGEKRPGSIQGPRGFPFRSCRIAGIDDLLPAFGPINRGSANFRGCLRQQCIESAFEAPRNSLVHFWVFGSLRSIGRAVTFQLSSSKRPSEPYSECGCLVFAKGWRARPREPAGGTDSPRSLPCWPRPRPLWTRSLFQPVR